MKKRRRGKMMGERERVCVSLSACERHANGRESSWEGRRRQREESEGEKDGTQERNGKQVVLIDFWFCSCGACVLSLSLFSSKREAAERLVEREKTAKRA